MRNEKRKFWQLLLGVLAFGGFIYVSINYPPGFNLPTLFFFVLFSVSAWLISRFFLKSSIQASLISISILSYLIVRTFGLKEPLFLLLFVILFITLELFFRKN